MKWIVIVVLGASVGSGFAQSRDSAIRSVSDTGAFVMQKSPLTATLLSAALPGAGQWYNEDYVKIPFIWGVSGFLLYEVIQNNTNFLKYQDLYFNSPDSTIRGSKQYFGLKEQYRDDRDYYGAFLFLAYVVNVLDAYVGAHLFDFPVTGSMHISSLHWNPVVTPSRSIGVGVRIGLQ